MNGITAPKDLLQKNNLENMEFLGVSRKILEYRKEILPDYFMASIFCKFLIRIKMG